VLDHALQMHHADLKTANTKEAPSRVAPTALTDLSVAAGAVQAVLAPASWNVIRLRER
jgi:alpha-L-arabinofuranosidase